jgi:hypothetical protein
MQRSPGRRLRGVADEEGKVENKVGRTGDLRTDIRTPGKNHAVSG